MEESDLPFGFHDLWDTRLLAIREITEPLRGAREAFRVSESGGCPRVAFMARAKVPEVKPVDADARRVFFLGDMLERMVVETYRDCGLLIARQAKLRDEELEFTGSTDAIWGGKLVEPELNAGWSDYYTDQVRNTFQRTLETYGEEVPVVLDEIKSVGQYGIDKILPGTISHARKPGKEYGTEQYLTQLAVYRIIADRHPEQLPVPIDEWQLTMVGKDKGDGRSFLLRDEDIDRAWDQLMLFVSHWAAGSDPGCTCKSESEKWRVRFCRYGNGVDECCTDALFDEVWKEMEDE